MFKFAGAPVDSLRGSVISQFEIKTAVRKREHTFQATASRWSFQRRGRGLPCSSRAPIAITSLELFIALYTQVIGIKPNQAGHRISTSQRRQPQVEEQEFDFKLHALSTLLCLPVLEQQGKGQTSVVTDITMCSYFLATLVLCFTYCLGILSSSC